MEAASACCPSLFFMTSKEEMKYSTTTNAQCDTTLVVSTYDHILYNIKDLCGGVGEHGKRNTVFTYQKKNKCCIPSQVTNLWSIPRARRGNNSRESHFISFVYRREEIFFICVTSSFFIICHKSGTRDPTLAIYIIYY